LEESKDKKKDFCNLILGIDDAARGPVVGPMVLAGVLINESAEEEFRKLGVKDSKQLTQKRREIFEKTIIEKSISFHLAITFPEEIDRALESGTNLNELEAIKAAEIINKLNEGKTKIKVIVDCPSVSIMKWTDTLKMKIKHLANLKISCEHKADANHVSVSAASVLAKCERERQMDKLREKYGPEIGSGYTSDPSTCMFLEKNSEKYSDAGIFRKTWITYKNACKKAEQKTLF